MGLLGTIFKVIGAILLVLVGLGAYLYFTDYEAQASVTDRSQACSGGAGTITVTPDLAPTLHHELALDCDVWQVVCVGYDVTYRVQTKHTIVKQDDRVLYDSKTGEKDVLGLARCGAQNL